MMEDERKLLINTFKNCKKKLEAAWNNTVQRIAKVQVRSEDIRKEGNALYMKDKHDAQTHLLILSHYCRSIALAPNNSEVLALGYGNRSAFLLHIGKCRESIQDIDRAAGMTNSKVLKVKLLCRKVKCLKILGLSGYKSILEEIKSLIDKMNENDGNKKQVLNMMNQAKDFSSNNEESTVKEDIKKKLLEILSQKELTDVLHSVDIRYNEKFGRHLVAARDFQPGEIIFVEKLYATVLNKAKYYTNCYSCLKICWSGIPCDHCSWAMFCSETCKTEAWEKCHDLECSLIPHVFILCEEIIQKYLLHNYRICVRLLITGIKEAGSISKLKAELESIDKCSDTTYRGFLKNGKMMNNTFKSVYTLKDKKITNPLQQETIAVVVIHVLICLIKKTSLFGKTFENKGINDLMLNEEILFLGSLLIKLMKIKEVNVHVIDNFAHVCECSSDKNKCIKNKCCERGSCIAPMACLINHSCFRNVSRCFTEDKKIIIFAVQPIKKNSQIFDSYIYNFYNSSITKRKEFTKTYEFVCNCPACSENWPALLDLPRHLREELNAIPKSTLEIKLYKDCEHIFACLDYGQLQFDFGAVKTLSKAIVRAIKSLKQPSEITCLMIAALDKVFSHIYGLELQSFKQCKYK